MKEQLNIVGLVIVLIWLYFSFTAPARFRRRLDELAEMETSDLKHLFDDLSHHLLFSQAANVLRERGEDLSFVFPVFLNMALSRNPSLYLLGRVLLQKHFTDAVAGIDFSQKPMSDESKEKLQALQRQLDLMT